MISLTRILLTLPLLAFSAEASMVAQADAAQGQSSPQSTAATPSPGAAPATQKSGEVLFERHTPSDAQTPGTLDDTTDSSQGRSAAGVSSSQRRPRTVLRRRGEEAPPSATGTESSAAAATSQAFSSSIGSSEQAELQLTLTPEDIAAAKAVSAAERNAIAIAGRDLELHLNTHTGQVEVHARLSLRNSGTEPLRQIALRISGALRWESARVAGDPVPSVQQHRIADDLDHTGVASELVLPLQQALPPGSSVQLDVYYGGVLGASTQRLTQLGAPAGRAMLTDWDTVSDAFTGLRGEGNVLWYPVAGAPASLREGSAVTDAVEASRAAEASSSFHLQLTVEHAAARPDSAFFCGEHQPLTVLADAGETDASFATGEWTLSALRSHIPSLFLSGAAVAEERNGLVRVASDDPDAAMALQHDASLLRPMLQDWLGAAPNRVLNVIDLPVPGAAGFADGALLVEPLGTLSSSQLAGTLVQPLVAAWLPDGIAAAWLREGIPEFLQTVYVERVAGRDAALTALQRSLRSQVDAASSEGDAAFSSSTAPVPVRMAGLPLAVCTDPACARVRSAYVFQMLRTLLGTAALQQALSGWAVQQAAHPGRTAAEETAALELLLQQVAGKRDLHWFFANWIDEDRGLPELQIVTVAPRRIEWSKPSDIIAAPKKPVAGPIGAEPVAPSDPRDADAYAAAHSNDAAPGSWLVAVEVQNNGGADAEVPVTVRAGDLSNSLPLRVPAHARATIRIPFEAEPEEVQVNDGSVPETIPVQHRRALRTLTR